MWINIVYFIRIGEGEELACIIFWDYLFQELVNTLPNSIPGYPSAICLIVNFKEPSLYTWILDNTDPEYIDHLL